MLTATSMDQRGGTLAGMLIGIVIGLAAAVATALFVTQANVPFIGARQGADQRLATGRSEDKPPAPTAGAGTIPDPNQTAAARTTPKQAAPGLERGPIASVTVEAPAEAAPPPPPASVTSPRQAPVAPGSAPSAAGGPTQPIPMPPPNRADPRAPGQPASTATRPVADPGAQPGAGAQVATAEGQTIYLLQAGAYRAPNDAESMKAKLALMGFEAQIVAADVNGATLHRVRVGPYGGLDAMNRARSRLAENGIEATVLRQR
jgi:cell division protein FtsN